MLLHRRPDEHLPAPPRDEVDVGRADDVADQLRPGEPHQLALDRPQPELGHRPGDVLAPDPAGQDDDLGPHAEGDLPGHPGDGLDLPRGVLDPGRPAADGHAAPECA